MEAVNDFDHQHGNASLPISQFSTYHFGFQCYQDASSNRYSRTYPNTSDTSAPVIDFAAGFHTFGVEVNDTGLRWYIDGETFFDFVPAPQSDPSFKWGSSPYPPFSELFMILNVAVATWGCPQPVPMEGWATGGPSQLLVDWVRVYEFVPSCGGAGGEL